jgi:hypothetical protein
MKGILLDKDGDFLIKTKQGSDGRLISGMIIGNNAVQCAGFVLQMNQGELKEDPIIGANLFREIRGKLNREKISDKIETSLIRANINIEEVRREMQVSINKNTIVI